MGDILKKRSNVRRWLRQHEWFAVVKVFSQPDWIIAILSIVFLVVQSSNGNTLFPFLLWILVVLLTIQALTIHSVELYKLKDKPAIYRGRGVISWASGVVLWGLAISLSGGLFSPLLYLILLAVLHYMRNPRRQRYAVAGILLFIAVFGPLLLEKTFDWQAVIPAQTIRNGIVFGVGIIAVLAYGVILTENRPLEVDFLSSVGTFWAGSMTQDSFYRSVLARAMRLYQAEWGIVAIRLPNGKDTTTSQSQDSNARTGTNAKQDEKQQKYMVRYRAGHQIDDPLAHEELIIEEDDLEVTRSKRGAAVQYFEKPPEGFGVIWPVRSFSFTVKRFQTQETVAIFTVFTKRKHSLKRHRPLLPASLYYLDILRAEAETVCGMFTYMDSYRKLLLAEDHGEFEDELRRTCNELIPPSSGPVELDLSVLAAPPDDRTGAIVPVAVELDEGRRRPRWLTAMARVKKPDMFAIHTLHNYLSDAANATILRQKMDREEALKASQKGVIGLSNLEPRGHDKEDDKEFIKKINEWSFRDDVFDDIFEGCGFRVLWVNQLMRIWNPDIPPEKVLLKAENKKYHCYHWFNSKDQKRPCWDCPCLYLYGKYLLSKTDEDRKRVADSLEVRPSYSPAGKMQIYRHFELGAALVLNEFAPKYARPEDKVSFIRETVIDRTLEVEVLAILTAIANTLELFPGRSSGGDELDKSGYDNLLEEMFQIVVEGLGRSFQANHVMRIDLGPMMAKIDADYVCECAKKHVDQRKELVDKEREVLERVRRNRRGLQEYFKERDPLFNKIKIDDETPVPDEIAEELRKRRTKYERRDIADEILDREIAGLFEWTTDPGWPDRKDVRCIIVRIPTTNTILLALTDEPEDRERVREGGKLLPRLMEKELCQSVGNMLGLLLQAVNNAMHQREAEMKAVKETWRIAAGAFAHRIGNILPVAQSRFNRIRSEPQASDVIKEHIKVGLGSVNRVFQVVEAFRKHGITNPLELREEQLIEVLEKLLTYCRDQHPDLAIESKYDRDHLIPSRLRSDIEALKDVFLSLVIDSVLYHLDGRPKIAIDCYLPDQTENCKIIYSDNGPGVSDENKEKIFEPFFSTSRTGTGIGLTDIRNTIQAHGGSIRETGKYGEGVRFEIILPTI